MKRVPLAFLNLLHNRSRFMVAIAGVAFAVLLIFMNLGFLGALIRTTTVFYDQFNADLFLMSPDSLEISKTVPFPMSSLYQLAGLKGVDKVMPLYVDYIPWKNSDTGIIKPILVYGFNLDDPVFLMPELNTPEALQALRFPNTVFIDKRSSPEYGPLTLDVQTEADRRRVRIVGQYELGGGFAADGTLIISDHNFARFFNPRSLNQINLGLVSLSPEANLEEMKKVVKDILPSNVEVFTKSEIQRRDSAYWIKSTSLGFIFVMGVIVSFIVGTSIVYQILYTDIRDHLKEYATLKALGYPGNYLFQVVLQESLILAITGFIPGFIAALGLYKMTARATSGGIPILMTPSRFIFVLVLTVLMCAFSGLVSVNKAVTADPVDVFN
ncbi:DevC protein [filamentous cyanobacterium CCP3]|nr:DevC protein [filamentous cyanobacterium CCP3]